MYSTFKFLILTINAALLFTGFMIPELRRILTQIHFSTQDHFLPDSPGMQFLPAIFHNLFFQHIWLHCRMVSHHLTPESCCKGAPILYEMLQVRGTRELTSTTIYPKKLFYDSQTISGKGKTYHQMQKAPSFGVFPVCLPLIPTALVKVPPWYSNSQHEIT